MRTALRCGRFAALLLGLGLAGWLAMPAEAATVALSASQYNTLFGPGNAANSMGAGQHMFAGGTRKDRALIAFNLGAIPAGATINSASVVMYMDRANGSTTYAMYLNEVTSAWGAGASHIAAGADGYDQDLGIRGGGGSGVASTNNDANWNYRICNKSNPAASIPWTTAGGDFEAIPSAATGVGAGMSTSGMTPLQCTWTGTGLAADVQAWLDGTDANYGWMLKGDELSSTGDNPRRFMSPGNWFNGSNPRINYDGAGAIATDGSLTPDFRPVLIVDYTPAPEPASLALLACGGLALLRRRAVR